METVVDTNNGVEHQNKDFENEYLKQFKDNSLSGMLTVLIEQFLPDKYKREWLLLYSNSTFTVTPV